MVLKRTGCWKKSDVRLLGAGVLGDGLGTLGDGVLGELTREEESDSSLDLTGGDGGPLVVVGESAGLGGDSLEQIVDERVHDGHGLGGDSGVRVDLLQHLVDVDGVGLLPSQLLLLLVALVDCLGGLAGLLGGFSRNLGWHVDAMSVAIRVTAMTHFRRLFTQTGVTPGAPQPPDGAVFRLVRQKVSGCRWLFIHGAVTSLA